MKSNRFYMRRGRLTSYCTKARIRAKCSILVLVAACLALLSAAPYAQQNPTIKTKSGWIFPARLESVLLFGGGTAVSSSSGSSETYRLSADFKGSFLDSDTWGYYVGVTLANSNHIFSTENATIQRPSSILNGLNNPDCEVVNGAREVGECLFFNPLSSSFITDSFITRLNDSSLLDFAADTHIIDTESELLVVDALLVGTPGATAGGDIDLLVGAKYHREESSRGHDSLFSTDAFAFMMGDSDVSDEHDIYALFTKLDIPLTPSLDLSAALRFEDYGSRIGETVDPKVSLLYKPADNLTLKASVSSSFRAPSQFQSGSEVISLHQVIDPLGDTAFAIVRNLRPYLSDCDIQPEQSKAFNLGVSFTPIDSLDIGLAYWNLEFTDAIIQEHFQAVVDASPTGSRVIRSLEGAILFVFTDFVNVGDVETDGIDISAKYDIDVDSGSLSTFLDFTHVFNYDIGDPHADFDGAENFTHFGSSAPKIRYTAGVTYRNTWMRARVAFRHISLFDGLLNDDQNGQEIDSFDTIDAQFSFNLQKILGTIGSYNATIGTTNLSNDIAPQVFTNEGFEPRTHDQRGRLVYARLQAAF